jgi:hypothetical protein
MLKYRCNPGDLEAMALLQEISGDLSPPWRSVEQPQPAAAALPHQPGSRQHCVLVLAWWRWWQHSVATPSRIPTSAFGQRDVGTTGRIQKRSSTTAAPGVASVMSSTSGRVASATPWSTPSVGWTSGCRRKHQWTLSILNVNY